MQPYLFPYIGYFQLIKAVDKYIIYDDVNYIQRGWINRNRMLINGKAQFFTVPCNKSSQNKLINEIAVDLDHKTQKKLLMTFEHHYKKAPMFREVIGLISSAFNFEDRNLSNFLFNSVKLVCNYLNIKTPILKSSENHSLNQGMTKADRLIDITIAEGADEYINAIGGQKLYNKEYFSSKGVHLGFLQTEAVEYNQFGNNFVPDLSIIDVMMFNTKDKVIAMLGNYEII